MNRSWRYLLISIVMLLGIVSVMRDGPVAQGVEYHDFADQRTMLGIPNALNVLSNIPFFFVGLWGLWVAMRPAPGSFSDRGERWAYVVLFAGVTLTCFGSSYYHWNPNNDTLVWDRIPMSIGFAGLLTATIGERCNRAWGKRLLVPLILVGIGSVIYWHLSELRGHGDLRAYILVQFGSLLMVLMLMGLFTPSYTRSKWLLVAIGFYALAKVLEAKDDEIYSALGRNVSGHSLKHLAAAAAIVPIAWMIARREPRTASA